MIHFSSFSPPPSSRCSTCVSWTSTSCERAHSLVAFRPRSRVCVCACAKKAASDLGREKVQLFGYVRRSRNFWNQKRCCSANRWVESGSCERSMPLYGVHISEPERRIWLCIGAQPIWWMNQTRATRSANDLNGSRLTKKMCRGARPFNITIYGF